MKNSRIMTAVLLIIMILLAIDVASRVLTQEPKVLAGNNLEYKVVPMTEAGTAKQFEKILNEMASKGWKFENYSITSQGRGVAVFSK